MKKLLLVLLFAFYSFSITNSNSLPVSHDYLSYSYYEYKIISELEFIKDNANRKLNIESSHENLPLGIPLNSDSIELTSKYGVRQKHPILGTKSFHKGIDIAANKGTNVISLIKGIVLRRTYNFMGYGKIIEIKHENGISTIYAHLDKTFVVKGDSIKPNQVIGTVGSTGLSTGNHLHYEIIKNGRAIDPLSIYLPNENIKFTNLKNINKILKLSKMKTKEIVHKLSLGELKELKDKIVKNINSIQYSIKNGSVKKESSFENALNNIEIKQKNLVRIKSLLSKANAIEFEDSEMNEKISNNDNIFKLALYRDLKKTLMESPKESFSEIKIAKKKEIMEKINSIDSDIRKFNENTEVEISLLEKDI